MCPHQRANPASVTAESVPVRSNEPRWLAVMTARRVGLRARDAVASQRAADGAGPSIEGARTHAHLIRRGAVAGFSAFCSSKKPEPKAKRFGKASRRCDRIATHLPMRPFPMILGSNFRGARFPIFGWWPHGQVVARPTVASWDRILATKPSLGMVNFLEPGPVAVEPPALAPPLHGRP